MVCDMLNLEKDEVITDQGELTEKWWKEAYRDIINGKISAVRYTIIENPTEYPKIWRVFERV